MFVSRSVQQKQRRRVRGFQLAAFVLLTAARLGDHLVVHMTPCTTGRHTQTPSHALTTNVLCTPPATSLNSPGWRHPYTQGLQRQAAAAALGECARGTTPTTGQHQIQWNQLKRGPIRSQRKPVGLGAESAGGVAAAAYD